jgi:hypothetical protein
MHAETSVLQSEVCSENSHGIFVVGATAELHLTRGDLPPDLGLCRLA